MRRRLGLQLLEGPRLVREGLRAERVAELFVATDEARTRWRESAGAVPVHRIAAADLARLSQVRTPQEVVAVGPLPEVHRAGEVLSACPRILLLDEVQDPGNVGTLARTALALGCTGIIVTPGTADLANPKVLRASAGALLFLRLGQATPDGLETDLDATEHTLVLPVVRGGRDMRKVTAPERFVLVAGNEGAGTRLSQARRALRVTIPMAAEVESLNVGAACAAILGRWLSPP